MIAVPALAKYMILAVALSALGSTLASLVSPVRVTFAMGAGGVLPRLFGRTDARFKSPVLATVIICVIASMGLSRCSDAVERGCWGSVITVRGVTRGYLTHDDPAGRLSLFRWG